MLTMNKVNCIWDCIRRTVAPKDIFSFHPPPVSHDVVTSRLVCPSVGIPAVDWWGGTGEDLFHTHSTPGTCCPWRATVLSRQLQILLLCESPGYIPPLHSPSYLPESTDDS